MAKRNMPKMAKPENFETKADKKVISEEVVEPVEEIEDEGGTEATTEEVKKPETPKVRLVTVNSSKNLRLRVASSTSADVLALLNPGTQCEVIDDNGEWLKVNVAGKVGYVMSKFVK